VDQSVDDVMTASFGRAVRNRMLGGGGGGGESGGGAGGVPVTMSPGGEAIDVYASSARVSSAKGKSMSYAGTSRRQ
jgi:hypothetical protein